MRPLSKFYLTLYDGWPSLWEIAMAKAKIKAKTPAKTKTKAKTKAEAKTKAKTKAMAMAKAPGPSGYLLGQIELFGFDFAPQGFAACQGQLLAISQNQQLFSLIGTNYGGNGTTNFALPKLAPVTQEGPYYFICISGTYPTRG